MLCGMQLRNVHGQLWAARRAALEQDRSHQDSKFSRLPGSPEEVTQGRRGWVLSSPFTEWGSYSQSGLLLRALLVPYCIILLMALFSQTWSSCIKREREEESKLKANRKPGCWLHLLRPTPSNLFKSLLVSRYFRVHLNSVTHIATGG